MSSRRQATLLLLPLIGGVVLRLIWVGDMEFKADEAYLFAHAQAGALPGLGQASGVGLRNPGLSVWIFVALDHGFGLHTPTALARGVMLVNVAALALLAVFATRYVARPERERWLWATALTAVNPTLIVFSRKLWAQSVLPFFTMLALLCWWQRGRARMSFAWGMSGALLGQIHMSGFFFAGALASWTALFDRRSARWPAWLAGSAVGALPLIPWVHYVLTQHVPTRHALRNLVELTFWRLWLERTAGIDLYTSLGRHAPSFLAEPRVGGHATYVVALLYAISVGGGLLILAGGGRALWPRRGDWRAMLAGRTSTALAVGATLVGFGILLTATAATIYRHYLIVAFALPFAWLAGLALLQPRRGRRALAALCVCQAAISVAFLAHIHVHGGAPGADYGVAYDRQPAVAGPRPH